MPLGERAISLLHQVKAKAPSSKLVFPGRRPDRPLSNMVFLMTLRRMGLTYTAHGFRSEIAPFR